MVYTIGPEYNSFFNHTEGVATAAAAGVEFEREGDIYHVALDLDPVYEGEQATLVFRLINNDTDNETSVHIESVDVVGDCDCCRWQNPVAPLDTNRDTVISPIDVLLIVNQMNSEGAGPVPELLSERVPPPFYDVNCDSYISPLDALLIVNHLNSRAGGEGEQSVQLQVTPLTQDGQLFVQERAKFWVVDSASDQAFRYDEAGMGLGSFSTADTSQDARGITSIVTGDVYWIVDETNQQVAVYGQGGRHVGNWKALDLVDPQGIATDGTDIWIVDAHQRQVMRYAAAAWRMTGTMSPTDRFSLDPENTSPTGITTDGHTLWVSDEGARQIFTYNRDGKVLGNWELDPRNAHPSGLTIDPSGGDSIWVVDREADAVYHYPDTTSRRHGAAAATIAFSLAESNSSPEGIADPPPSLDLVSPADGHAVGAGETVLITGSANASDTAAELMTVTINDRPVDAVDTSGRFFHAVNTRPGRKRVPGIGD